MSRILLTHSPDTLANYYGQRALAGLKALCGVILNPADMPLECEALVRAAADCDLIVFYRQSPAPAALFERLPRLVAFLRCAIDIRNVDVGRAPDQIPTPAIAARPDVIATPHCAGLTLPAIEHQSMETVAQVAEILKGRAPKGTVNAQCWTRKELLNT
jgi:phosphoglycerate dehydrogenase-like enzyme